MFLIIGSFFILITFLLGYFKKPKYRSFFQFGFISFSVLIVLEVTLFNFRFYESISYQEIPIKDWKVGEGIEVSKNGEMRVVRDDHNFIEIKNIDKHLDNVYLEFKVNNEQGKGLFMSIGYTDEANANYTYTQYQTISSYKNHGQYSRLHLAGKSEKIKIYFKTWTPEDTFTISKFSFNKPVPLHLSFVRPFLIFIFLIAFYIFRPKSSLYKMNILDNKSELFVYFTLFLEILSLTVVFQFNNYFIAEKYPTKQRYQYQMLTESIMNGKPYLEEKPSDIMKTLENPYDKKNRGLAFTGTDDYYLWDVAYFNHRYYVYFGIAPVVLYYLPFYALTGHHLKTSVCIYISIVLAVIGIFLLLYHLCKKYFSKVNLGAFLAITLLFINACGILSIAGRPDHYSLPILMGIMFSIYGLYWWIKAKENNLNKKYLILGSISMAMVAACRPQLLLTSFFAVPIFWSDIKQMKLFRKDNVKKILAFAIPFIVIAALLMWYNFIRFGSPFDFGANYNLTTNDMTRRGFVFDRIPLGIYYYLFAPLKFTLQFPFVQRSAITTSYLGTTIYEDMGAGFIVVNLLTIFGFMIFKYRKEIKSKMLYYIGALSIIFSIIIIAADTNMAGILPRYICDFGYLIYLGTAIVLFHLLDKNKGDKQKQLINIIYICFIIGLLYNFFLLFSDFVIMKARIFYYLKQLLEFWI